MTPNELPNPRSRVEDYLAVLVEMTGAKIPEGVPRSRVEAYLRYICEEGVSGLKNGYYYEGAFYKDAEHTELIEPKDGRAYLDVANLAIYVYQDGVYKDALPNKADLVNGKVPESQLPAYVDDVIEKEDFAHLPETGESGKIYVTLDTGESWRWTGTTYSLVATPDSVSYKAQSGKTEEEKLQARKNIGLAEATDAEIDTILNS